MAPQGISVFSAVTCSVTSAPSANTTSSPSARRQYWASAAFPFTVMPQGSPAPS